MFVRTVDLAPNIGFRRSWYCWKACATLFLKVLDLQETELGLERYDLANRGHRRFLARRRAIFRSRFQLDQENSWRSESCTPCLNMSSFLRTQAYGSNRCETERIFARAQHPPGGSYEIFSIVLFLPSVFEHMVDVAPDVGFRRS